MLFRLQEIILKNKKHHKNEMKKLFYTAPEIEEVMVMVEKGFGASTETDGQWGGGTSSGGSTGDEWED